MVRQSTEKLQRLDREFVGRVDKVDPALPYRRRVTHLPRIWKLPDWRESAQARQENLSGEVIRLKRKNGVFLLTMWVRIPARGEDKGGNEDEKVLAPVFARPGR